MTVHTGMRNGPWHKYVILGRGLTQAELTDHEGFVDPELLLKIRMG